MNLTERSEQLMRYGSAYEMLTKAIRNFPVEMWTYKPDSKSWSIHEIIIHITDSEANSYTRCRCLIAESGKTIMAYNQDAWAKNLHYHQISTEDALDLFRMLRLASFKLISSVSPETWTNTIHHPENGLMSMDDWLFEYANHIPVHIAQMQRIYDAWESQLK